MVAVDPELAEHLGSIRSPRDDGSRRGAHPGRGRVACDSRRACGGSCCRRASRRRRRALRRGRAPATDRGVRGADLEPDRLAGATHLEAPVVGDGGDEHETPTALREDVGDLQDRRVDARVVDLDVHHLLARGDPEGRGAGGVHDRVVHQFGAEQLDLVVVVVELGVVEDVPHEVASLVTGSDTRGEQGLRREHHASSREATREPQMGARIGVAPNERVTVDAESALVLGGRVASVVSTSPSSAHTWA